MILQKVVRLFGAKQKRGNLTSLLGGVALLLVSIFSLYSFCFFGGESVLYFAEKQSIFSRLSEQLGSNFAFVLRSIFGIGTPVFSALIGYVSLALIFDWRFSRLVDRIVGLSLLTALVAMFPMLGKPIQALSVETGYLGWNLGRLFAFVQDVILRKTVFIFLLWISLVLTFRQIFMPLSKMICVFARFLWRRGLFLRQISSYCLMAVRVVVLGCGWVVRRSYKIFDGRDGEDDEEISVPEFEFEQDEIRGGQEAYDLWENEPQPEETVVERGVVAAKDRVAKEPCAKKKTVKFDDLLKQEGVNCYKVPDVTIFEMRGVKQGDRPREILEDRARVLEEKLNRFGVSGRVVSIRPGPVVVLFEYQPEIDIKISRIISLEDDLALALRALSIRIIAPIPGTSVVGFEVANVDRDDVFLSDVLHSKEFAKYEGQLPLVLGKDTVGQNVVVDLADMPHLLIAGSTGSGKSVALNTMLVSLLCRLKPDELRLILIDPKRLEFSAYSDIAHLVFPIVTEVRQAPFVLKWVVGEMEERYEKMAKLGVRSITDYNKKVAGSKEHEKIPFMVVVIDELSDLMLTVGREVEDLITRLAQMARAVGIHLIVATQRPSVDVITGLIKVNFSSRISFRVTSKVDSRTILDCTGAEKLLGKGDMFFLSSRETSLKRVHGAYVSDREISQLVDYIRAEQAAEYADLSEKVKEKQAGLLDGDEELYEEILQFLKEADEVSISMLQRRFRIGFNRSARIIDLLEEQGHVMPSDGGKGRKVVR